MFHSSLYLSSVRIVLALPLKSDIHADQEVDVGVLWPGHGAGGAWCCGSSGKGDMLFRAD